MDASQEEWIIENAYASLSRFKKFSKNHSREYISLFTNLDKIVQLLRKGHKLGSFQIGFFRSENDGLYRIGQTGVPGAKESRLYIYPVEAKHTIYILSIGTKESQSDDIKAAKDCINKTISKL